MTDPLETRLAALERDRAAAATTLPDATSPVKRPTALQFIESLKITDRESGKTIPFKLWPAQRDMLQARWSPRSVWSSSRRASSGCSWLALAYMLYLATFEPGQLFLVARQSLEEAGEGIVRLRMMNESVPDRWRQDATTDNVFSLGFANGARIRALSSTKRMGRGLSARYVISDELGFWDDPETQLAALEPGAQRLHVISTGDGPDTSSIASTWKRSPARVAGASASTPGPPTLIAVAVGTTDNVEIEPLADPRQARVRGQARRRLHFAVGELLRALRLDPQRRRHRHRGELGDVAVPSTSDTEALPACGCRSRRWASRSWSPSSCPHDMTTSEFAGAIVAKEAAFGLAEEPRGTYCDPAGNAVNVQTTQTDFALFKQAGLSPIAKASGIRDGCVALMEQLADPVLPLVISTRCEWLIKAFSTVSPDKNHPEVYDEGSEFTHALDALRYFFINHYLGPDNWLSPTGTRCPPPARCSDHGPRRLCQLDEMAACYGDCRPCGPMERGSVLSMTLHERWWPPIFKRERAPCMTPCHARSRPTVTDSREKAPLRLHRAGHPAGHAFRGRPVDRTPAHRPVLRSWTPVLVALGQYVIQPRDRPSRRSHSPVRPCEAPSASESVPRVL